MIKAVIFDFDGTITNRKIGAYRTYRGYFDLKFPEKDDLERESIVQDAMLYESNGAHKYVAELLARKYDFLKGFETDFWDYYDSHIVSNMYLRPEIPEILTNLGKNYKLAILTNGGSEVQNGKIDHVGVRKYFDVVLTSGEIGYDKPDFRAYKAVCDRLGVQMDECVYVGDVFSNDIYGSCKANIKPIWFIDSGTVNAYKGTIIHDLHELQGVINSL